MQAREIFEQCVKSGDVRKHCREVEEIMRLLAREFAENEEEWAIAGLMHDLDFEEGMDAKQHGIKTVEILKKENYSDDICHAILAHNEENTGVKRESRFDYALSAADNISGLIYAYGLMRKTLDGMEVSGVKKKLKDKRFAEGVRRDLIYDFEKFISIERFIEIAIEAMQGISKEIGFS